MFWCIKRIKTRFSFTLISSSTLALSNGIQQHWSVHINKLAHETEWNISFERVFRLRFLCSHFLIKNCVSKIVGFSKWFTLIAVRWIGNKIKNEIRGDEIGLIMNCDSLNQHSSSLFIYTQSIEWNKK